MMNISLADIANKIQGTVVGDSDIQISCLSPIEDIRAGSLVLAKGLKNLKLAEQSAASAVLLDSQTISLLKPAIQVAQPLKAFIHLLTIFYPPVKIPAFIHPTAVIASKVVLGKNIFIGPYVVIETGSIIGDNCVIKGHVNIGQEVIIGADTTIYPQVTIYDNTQIGARVSIHASSVIGSDGFGYTFVDGEHLKVPHVGSVIIGDDVEIGANTVIDRAALGTTEIGKGTKIDNLVQIAHSVKLGQHNLLCAFTGVAGSTTSGNHVTFAANVGVSDHVQIDEGVILAARAGVPPNKHLKKGNIYLGNPARPKEKALEQELAVACLPIMRKNLRALSKKVDNLSKQLMHLEV